MSIYAYVGLPGSGKSYSTVVNQILPGLKLGRRIVTNVPLVRDEIRKIVVTGEIVELPLEKIAQEPEILDQYCTPGSLVIIDECWRLWPAGMKVHQVPEPFKSLLAEHRHKVDALGNSMQIVLVTQDLAQIGAFARQLVEQTMVHVQLGHVGQATKYRVDIFRGAVTGPSPPIQNRVREVFGRYEKKYFPLYKSHTMASTTNIEHKINERNVDTRGNILKRPMIVVGAVFVLVCVWFGISTLVSYVSPDRFAASEATSDSIPATVGTVAARPEFVPRVRTVVSKSAVKPDYRVVGYVASSMYSAVLIDDGGTVIRTPLDLCVFDDVKVISCFYRGWVVSRVGAMQQIVATRAASQ